MNEKKEQVTKEEINKANLELGKWLSEILNKAGGNCQITLTSMEFQVIVDQVIRLIKTKNESYNPEEEGEDEFIFKPFKLDILKPNLKINPPGYMG